MTSTSGPADRQRPVERFKPTGGLLLGWFGLAAAGFAILYVAWTVHTVVGLRIALGAAFFALVVWVTQLRPRATAYPRHVVLKNSLHDTHVPLAAVDEVAIGQTLALWVGKERHVCIGIGNSFREELRVRRRQEQSLGTSRLGELSIRAERANTDERAMSYQTFVVTRLEELVAQAKREQPGEAGEPRRVLAWPEVAALVVIGLAFVVSLFL
jgi:hypothetical protein